MITPTTPAVFYGFNEQLVRVPVVTLTVWCAGLKMPRSTSEFKACKRAVYKALECPKGYPVEHALEHLQTVKRETLEYYGVTA